MKFLRMSLKRISNQMIQKEIVSASTSFTNLVWIAFIHQVIFYFLASTCFFCFQANLVIQEARLNVAQGDLDKAQAILDEKQSELDVVQAMYDAAMKEKQARIFECENFY